MNAKKPGPYTPKSTSSRSAPKPASELSLEDTGPRPAPGGAYNPYDIDPKARRPLKPVAKQDLRKLSEWIKLKKEVEELKKEEPKD